MKRILSTLCALLLMLPHQASAMGAWLPCWDASAALEEASALADQLDQVCTFAASFDQGGRLILPEEARSLLLELQVAFAGTDTEVYLSVVNDLDSEAKSTRLLERLLATDTSLNSHIDDLIMLVDSTRVEFLEIDYENLGSDTRLWQRFTSFIEKLYQLLEQDGISLRVVLPWDAPRYALLPHGPEYSVMCYNLYGLHSDPGPKADFAFLEEIAALYAGIPNVRMALASGGFEWSANETRSLTQQQAETLLQRYDITPVRDETSGALTASYTLDGTSRTLWYADAQTLRLWQEHLPGFAGFDLFRLGGNNTADWLTHLMSTPLNEEAAP